MSLDQIINRLRNDIGRTFESAVSDGFAFLGFDAERIEVTDAESDVIVKARFAINPYYVVIECEAVRETNQVGYTKIGQLRGNFESYAERYEEYSSSYKMLVGKPVFSRNTIRRSQPDVSLLTAENLIKLIEYHYRFLFSQDEMERVFANAGLISEDNIDQLCHTYNKKLQLYSLIYLSLIQEPTKESLNRRIGYISLERLIGSVNMLAHFAELNIESDREIIEAIRDLHNPFLQILEYNELGIKLFSRSYEDMITSISYGSDLNRSLEETLSRLE